MTSPYILICSDLHANLHAMTRLRRYIDIIKPFSIYILGDLVGYGAYPNEVVDMVRDLKQIYEVHVLHGNHDQIVRDPNYRFNFHSEALRAAVWSDEQLTDTNRAFIRALPTEIEEDDRLFVHGSPTGFDEYILNNWDARDAFRIMELRDDHLCFFGHTHFPCVIQEDPSIEMDPYHEGWVCLNADNRYLINPGSVGQPRDRNPKLSFCLFDPHLYAVRNIRLNYDQEGAKNAIWDVEALPGSQGDRLLEGR